MIEIGKPEICRLEKSVRLECVIKENDKSYKIWFETDLGWGDYFVDDRIDGFLLCVLPHAMKTKQDIYSKYPVSQQLYYQLNHFQIPVCAKYVNINSNVFIHAETIKDIESSKEHYVATGLSNGVDSLYTIYKNICDVDKCVDYKVNCLAYFSVGAAGDFGGEEENELSEKRLEQVNLFAKEIGLPLISVESNINEIYDDEYYINVVSYRLMGCVLTLQHLFDVYYLATGYELADIHFPDDDPEFYDLLNCQDFSTKKTKFYSYGLEVSRIEKLKYISEFLLAKKYLQVCQTSYINCNRCEKCSRTMAELDVLGLLDDFAQVFDINYYLSKRERILGYGMAHKKGHSFWTDLYVELKRQKKMSYRIRAWWVYYTLRHFIARSMKPIANGYKRKVHNKYAGTSKQYADLYIRL